MRQAQILSNSLGFGQAWVKKFLLFHISLAGKLKLLIAE